MSKYISKVGLGAGVFAVAMVLGACSSNSGKEPFDKPLNSEFSVKSSEVVLTVPDIEEREQYQMVIARLTQILSTEQTTPEQRAQILYQLGILYDRLGLAVTARNMFMNALIEVPDYAAVYNFVGSYLAASERFSEAFDAFDAVLEIDPEESYAYFNRGIALYYGKRASLGIADLIKFYEFDKNDPFRIAWLYILEREVHGKDYAEEHLKSRRDEINEEVLWGLEILDFMSDEISSKQLIDAVRYAEIPNVEKSRRLCEAYFYMAKIAEFEGQMKRAYDLLHLCVATEVTGYLEYRYALMEIGRFERTELIAKAEQLADKRQAERNALFELQTKEAEKFFKDLQDSKSIPSNDRVIEPRIVPAVPATPKSQEEDDSEKNPVLPRSKNNRAGQAVPAASATPDTSATSPQEQVKENQEPINPEVKSSIPENEIKTNTAKVDNTKAIGGKSDKARVDKVQAETTSQPEVIATTQASVTTDEHLKSEVVKASQSEAQNAVQSEIIAPHMQKEEDIPVLKIIGGL